MRLYAGFAERILFYYRIRIFQSKNTVLNLAWIFFIFYAVNFFHFSSNKYNSYVAMISFGVCLLLGLLGDVYVGRYRCLHYCSRMAWVGSIALNTYYIIGNYVWQFPQIADIVIQVIFNGVIGVGLAGLVVSSFQLGLDQLVDASSVDIASYISWCTWLLYLASSVAALTTDCLCSDYEQPISALSVSFMMTLLVVTDCCFNHYLIKEPVTHNPLKLIFQVLRYAVKNKYPRLRSAFTYWEDKPYSRIDLGKSKYGGPFTTEQVEDVKTFFRILALLAAAIVWGALIDGQGTANTLLNLYYQDDHSIAAYDNCFTSEDWGNCIKQQIVTHISTFIVVMFVPIFELILYPLLNRWLHYNSFSILFRVQICIGTLMLCELSYLCIEIANTFSTDTSLNFTCFFYSAMKDKSTHKFHLQFVWLILPQIIYGVSLYCSITSGSEFIISQTPYSMRGIVIGLCCLLFGNFYVLVQELYKLVFKLLRKIVEPKSNCSIWYFTVILLLCLILFLVIAVSKRWYRLRRRDEVLCNQQIFAVNYYDKYLAQLPKQ